MKLVVTAAGTDLTSQVDPRFGRCPYYIFVDPKTNKFEAIENPHVQAMGGAGIQSAQFVANKGAEVVLTGSCGPNAFQTLQTAGVKVIVGIAGTVQDAVTRYKSGQLQPTPEPNVPSHYGMGYGAGQSMGPGYGGGMGMGRGMRRGMGRGMGYGMGYGPMPQAPGVQSSPAAPQAPGMGPAGPQPTPEQELQALKQQADFLRQQLDAINKRIGELEKK